MLPNLKPNVFRNSHQASVVAILGKDAPPVMSTGSKFYNVDRWTARFFLRQMCKWAKENPGLAPTQNDVSVWVSCANREPVNGRKIVTAAIPDNITTHLAYALIGGAYHEALHTRYSCRRDLTNTEMWDLVSRYWTRIPDWSNLETMLQEWSNVVEDIRIERRGCEEYPGIQSKLIHLQDFILEHEECSEWNALTTVMMTFRDLGLGYMTDTQDKALTQYQQYNPKAYEMVTNGPLSPLLSDTVVLSDQDDLGCIRIAFEIVTHIYSLSQEEPQTPSSEETQPNEGGVESEVDPIEVLLGLSSPTPGKGGEDSEEEAEALPFRDGHEWQEGGSSYWSDISNEMIHDETSRIKDMSSVLEEAVVQLVKREMLSLEMGEALWNPYDRTLDTVGYVEPSRTGSDLQRAQEILKSIKTESNYIRNKIRRLLYAQQERTVFHGVRKGPALSERMLVDTYTSLQSNQYPKRAYQKPADIRDLDFAAAIVVDESESMCWGGKLIDATRCMLAITEPLESLGVPVLAAGFRDGKYCSTFTSTTLGQHHRIHGVHVDVFKGFEDRFRQSLWRFACTRGVGGTPMADGIHYGYEMLRVRPEKQRVLFVITDGQPNAGHLPVMRYLMRKALGERILVVGVGIGMDAKYVTDVFESHLWSEHIKEMPKLLIQLLERLLL